MPYVAPSVEEQLVLLCKEAKSRSPRRDWNILMAKTCLAGAFCHNVATHTAVAVAKKRGNLERQVQEVGYDAMRTVMYRIDEPLGKGGAWSAAELHALLPHIERTTTVCCREDKTPLPTAAAAVSMATAAEGGGESKSDSGGGGVFGSASSSSAASSAAVASSSSGDGSRAAALRVTRAAIGGKQGKKQFVRLSV